MRAFEFVKDENGKKVYDGARLPVYATKHSAGADFFAAETVVIPPIKVIEVDCPEGEYDKVEYVIEGRPTLVHTGVCAELEECDVLNLYNRSGNPKMGLVLANGVGVVDSDYYGNASNGGDIMFAFYNFSSAPVEITEGQRIGQGVITSFYHADNAEILEHERRGGFGSTGA